MTTATVEVIIIIDGTTYSSFAVGDTSDVMFAFQVGKGVTMALLEHKPNPETHEQYDGTPENGSDGN